MVAFLIRAGAFCGNKILHKSCSVLIFYGRMIAFDIPSYNTQRVPYDSRYKILLENVTAIHPFVLSFNYSSLFLLPPPL